MLPFCLTIPLDHETTRVVISYNLPHVIARDFIYSSFSQLWHIPPDLHWFSFLEYFCTCFRSVNPNLMVSEVWYIVYISSQLMSCSVLAMIIVYCGPIGCKPSVGRHPFPLFWIFSKWTILFFILIIMIIILILHAD